MLLLAEIPLLALGFHTYWIIYLIPFFFLMLAQITVESIRALRSHRLRVHHLRLFRVLFLVVVMIFLVSQSTVGLAAPLVDRGDSEGIRLAALYLMHNARPGALVAIDPGNVFTLLYYVGAFQLNVTVLSLILPAPTPADQPQAGSRLTVGGNTAKWIVPGQLLQLRPDYIIMSRYALTWVLNQTMKSAIFSDYKDLHVYAPPVGYDAWNYWWAEVTGRVVFVLLQRVN